MVILVNCGERFSYLINNLNFKSQFTGHNSIMRFGNLSSIFKRGTTSDEESTKFIKMQIYAVF